MGRWPGSRWLALRCETKIAPPRWNSLLIRQENLPVSLGGKRYLYHLAFAGNSALGSFPYNDQSKYCVTLAASCTLILQVMKPNSYSYKVTQLATLAPDLIDLPGEPN